MTPEPPLGMDPDQRNVWDSGAESYRRGLPITTNHPYCCAMKEVWEMGWKAASEARVDEPTTQQLIDAWEKAHTSLSKHVQSVFPLGCNVEVDSKDYKGPGRVVYHSRDCPHKIEVESPDGSERWSVVTSVRRVS